MAAGVSCGWGSTHQHSKSHPLESKYICVMREFRCMILPLRFPHSSMGKVLHIQVEL